MDQRTPEPSHDDLITRSEAARLYGVEPATISAWLCRGDARLPRPIRMNRNYLRFRRGDVLARLAAIAAGNVVPLPRGDRLPASDRSSRPARDRREAT